MNLVAGGDLWIHSQWLQGDYLLLPVSGICASLAWRVKWIHLTFSELDDADENFSTDQTWRAARCCTKQRVWEGFPLQGCGAVQINIKLLRSISARWQRGVLPPIAHMSMVELWIKAGMLTNEGSFFSIYSLFSSNGSSCMKASNFSKFPIFAVVRKWLLKQVPVQNRYLACQSPNTAPTSPAPIYPSFSGKGVIPLHAMPVGASLLIAKKALGIARRSPRKSSGTASRTHSWMFSLPPGS